MKEDQLFESLLEMQKVVEGSTFSSWRKRFVDTNCDKFDYDDENKLEYTAIHTEYEEGIEKLLVQGMPKDFDMADFMQDLPGFLESEAGKKEEIGKIVQTLLEISDFRDFKEMMLFSKRAKEEAKEKAEGVVKKDMVEGTLDEKQSLIQVDGIIELCAQLSASEDASEGWQTVYKNEWMRIDKKAVEESKRSAKNEVYMRGSMTMNMSYIEAVDMFLYYGERRGLWDTNFKGYELPYGGDVFGDDDVVCISKIDFGTLMHMMGIPRSLSVKILRRWDFPKVGMVSSCLVPWDIKNNCVDTNNSILTMKTNTIMPHPTDPSKTVITTLEMNKLGGMPKWALNLLMTVTAPGMIRGLEQRYIKKIRDAKDQQTVDLTPEGRAKRPAGAAVW
mmetsp:Transcript_29277/g.45879  ORF Transcript_29277/g.45879 Transcript_29277/m.45879 type:complete len:389 (+) Transcript_29277:39-1205(+)|eukprot:CAMPEP_0184305360 /NCGR_PEP_ID=MMETSP1049-20130417/14657_1 /TAXON_ID=77928 /ORGANISM="Proteomonas sulcata, Strain CCMP704" /LENGTH=388 /DNA_ID=CAMNT_0026617411 /DNA_START=40 /DNA_END=1206 /DNA_ORIENTATION=-